MTIRLSPLVAEHTYPLLLDLAFFLVCCTAWVAVVGNFDGLGAAVVVLGAAGVHYDLHSGPDSRTVRTQQLIYAELERHGFPKPRPYVLDYRPGRDTSQK